MPILLADLVKEEDLGLQVILANQMERPLSWVHVTEMPDPSPWLGGDEMILTTGASLRGRKDRTVDFVRSLKTAGVNSIGWGFTADEISVPTTVIRQCQDAGLGLVAVPTRTPFLAVIRRFVDHLQAEREAAMRMSIERNNQMIRALGAGGSAMARLLSALRDETGRDLWVRSSTGRIHAQSTLDSQPPGEDAASWLIDASRTPEVRLVVAANHQDITPTLRTAVAEALPFLRFALARADDTEQAERRLATELIDVTIAGQTQFAMSRLLAYGLDPQGLLVGVVLLTPGVEDLRSMVRRELARLGYDSIAAKYDGATMVIVQPPTAPDVEALAHALTRGSGTETFVGIGAPASGAAELRESLLQAREAARHARRLGRSWARHDEVDTHDLLLALHDHGTLQTFRRNVLGPIVQHDEHNGTQLRETLEAFVNSGFHWQVTADALFIHVNTLRHRIARCEELTGRDLNNMSDRVDIYMALKIDR